MNNRRDFIKLSGPSLLGLLAAPNVFEAESKFTLGIGTRPYRCVTVEPSIRDFLFAPVGPEAMAKLQANLDRVEVAAVPETGPTFIKWGGQSGSQVSILNQATFCENADWQPQDYIDSQGIKAVRCENGRLVSEAGLKGGDPNLSKGEVFLDLAYFPGLECQVPIDFSQRQITVKVWVPGGFVGPTSARNGVQVFVKDDQYRSQYGEWKNVTAEGELTVTLNPPGYTDPGFNPARVRIIGVKFAIGTGSSATYNGPLYVDNLSINPSVTPTPPPVLPSSIPLPLLSPTDKIEVRANRFYWNNRKWFMVGANWRVIEYGLNFGALAWFPTGNGISKHPNFVRVNLDYARRAGVKVVRVNLLEDGRTMFDGGGRVIGYDELPARIFRRDVKTFLDLANQAGIKVEFVLFDFLIAGRQQLFNGVSLRGRSGVITEESLRRRFINEFLIPFLTEFKDHPAFLIGDVINETEWVVSQRDGGCWETYNDPNTKAEMPVPGPAMKTFITDCITTIRTRAPGKLVTVGSSASIQHISLERDLPTDYFALHLYPWMEPLREYLNRLPPGKPWSAEEFPTKFAANDTPNSISGYLDLVLREGGTGAMLWNLSPGIDTQTFSCGEREARLQELRRWVDGHPKDVCDCMLASVSAASYGQPPLAVESIVAGFGTQLATRLESATDVDPNRPGIQLPTSLAGTTVEVIDSAGNKRLAPLFFVSPDQINYQIPPGTALGFALVTVTSGDGSRAFGTPEIVAVSPGLFSANANGQGVAVGLVLRVRTNGSQVYEAIARFDSAQNKFVAVPIDLTTTSDQVFLILYGSGFRFRSALSAVTVSIGGVDSQVLYAGPQGDFVGLDQLNVRLSRELIGRGMVDVMLTVDGKAANTVQVAFR